MKRIITAAMVAALAAVAGHTVSAQAGDQQQNRPAQGSNQASGAQNNDPNRPDPNDKGGVFTLTGCLEQQPAAQGSPMAYKLTRITPATGEGRTAGAMGAGVGMGTQGSAGVRPSNPPDIVPSEYRIVAAENVALAPHANHKIEVRGSLSKNAAEAGAQATNRSGAAANSGSQGRTASASSTADKSNDVFIATSVRMVSDTCSS